MVEYVSCFVLIKLCKIAFGKIDRYSTFISIILSWGRYFDRLILLYVCCLVILSSTGVFAPLMQWCCLISRDLQVSQYIVSVTSSFVIHHSLIQGLFFSLCRFFEGLGAFTQTVVLNHGRSRRLDPVKLVSAHRRSQ